MKSLKKLKNIELKRVPVWVHVVHCKEEDGGLSAYVFAEDLPAQSWAKRLMDEDSVTGVNVQRLRVLEGVPGRAEAH